MTTTNTSDRTAAVANGTAPIPFTFQAASAGEVTVLRNNVPEYGSYTVDLNGDGTGTVTPSSSWGSDSILIYSSPSYQQTADFARFGPFYPDQFVPPIDRLARGLIALKGRLDATAPDSSLRVDLATPVGSALSGFTRSETGAAARSVQDKLRDVAHARDFGLVGDGSDEGVKLTRFINSAISSGVPHRLETGKTYGTSIVLPTIDVSGVRIEGIAGNIHDITSAFSLKATVIKWIGSATATPILTIAPAAGAGAQHLDGIELSFAIDCNSLASIGVRAHSVRDSKLHLTGANATGRLFDFGVISGALGENEGLAHNKIRLRGRQVEAPGGICLYLDGDDTANVCLNEIDAVFTHKNAAAVVCANSDNNVWRLHTQKAGGGTATESVSLLGGADANHSSRAEIFDWLTTDLPVHAYGTGAYTAASRGHRILVPDLENGTPAPIVDTSASIDSAYWLTYTPTITGAAGSGLTAANKNGSYRLLNGMVELELNFQITAGSGYTSISASLPINAHAAAFAAIGAAKETASGSKLFSAIVNASGTTVVLQSADGSTALPTGTYNVTVRYRPA